MNGLMLSKKSSITNRLRESPLIDLLKNPLAITGLVIIFVLIILAIIGPIIVDPNVQTIVLEDRLQEPSSIHWFGTDEMGRDVYGRIILGARISLQIGIVIVSIAVLAGSMVGLIAGYFGGWIDDIIMRIVDIFLSLPSLVLAMAISVSLGRSLINAMFAISIVWWPRYARLVRSNALAIKSADYVAASRSFGVKGLQIMVRHILPNCLTPIIIQASLDFGETIIWAAALGFLGLGAQPPTPEWGLMVSTGRAYFPGSWWTITFPGLAIFLTAIGFNLLGDTLRDNLDPRLDK